jgi:hypothetical protein
MHPFSASSPMIERASRSAAGRDGIGTLYFAALRIEQDVVAIAKMKEEKRQRPLLSRGAGAQKSLSRRGPRRSRRYCRIAELNK